MTDTVGSTEYWTRVAAALIRQQGGTVRVTNEEFAVPFELDIKALDNGEGCEYVSTEVDKRPGDQDG